MIVVDTNVLAEPLKRAPDPIVLTWIRDQDELGTTAVSVGEILVGVHRLSSGRRRDELLSAIEQVLVAFRGSVLAYDEGAARAYALLLERRRAAGVPLAVEDGMIAAICSVRSLTLATRNTRDFRGLGLSLVNPWGTGR